MYRVSSKPCRISEKALAAVIQKAWIGGGSTRKVDDLLPDSGLRNSLAHVPKGQQTVVAAAVRPAFNQPDQKGPWTSGVMWPAGFAPAGQNRQH